jgi:hypothetical protein
MAASAGEYAAPRPRLARAASSAAITRTAVALGALLVAAAAVRVWLLVAYGPAFLGFGDSHEYVTAAASGVFHDLQKPAGYPIFLVVLHALSHQLSFTIGVQHLLGLATGLLLYGAVARSGAPRWLGLIPAAVAFFGGTGLLLEHSLLADPLFAFLQAGALYLAVRALSDRRLRWALLAGLLTGASFWVKTVGVASVVVIPLVLLLAAEGGRGARVRRAASAAAAALALVLAYPVAQGLETGYWGYERQGAWNLYGRVATFVNCARFTPPARTRFLCPTEPLRARRSESYYQYATTAPAVRRFGGPSRAPAGANALLQRFSVSAIVHEPLSYADAILRGLTFFVSPRPGEGYTPSTIRSALLDPAGTRSIEPAVASYYAGAHGYRAGADAADALESYERHTRLQGVVLVLMLLAAVCGAPLLRGRVRAAAVLFTATALLEAVVAVAGNSYDARYAYPALGVLAVGAALGAWGIGRGVGSRLNSS